jgi:hypothetical protein
MLGHSIRSVELRCSNPVGAALDVSPLRGGGRAARGEEDEEGGAGDVGAVLAALAGDGEVV